MVVSDIFKGVLLDFVYIIWRKFSIVCILIMSNTKKCIQSQNKLILYMHLLYYVCFYEMYSRVTNHNIELVDVDVLRGDIRLK